MKESVEAVIQSQDDTGRWIVRNDQYRKSTRGRTWDGEYETQDRIGSALFNDNVAVLCEWLELHRDYAAQ